MLARIRKAQQENEGGFTLIELLVVMIIIGILAAIAIPAFLSQRAKAQDSAAKADVATIGKEIATYFVDNSAAPTIAITGTGAAARYNLTSTSVPAPGQDLGKVSSGVVLKAPAAATGVRTSTDWCVGVTNPNGSQKDYKYSAANGLESGICATLIAP